MDGTCPAFLGVYLFELPRVFGNGRAGDGCATAQRYVVSCDRCRCTWKARIQSCVCLSAYFCEMCGLCILFADMAEFILQEVCGMCEMG